MRLLLLFGILDTLLGNTESSISKYLYKRYIMEGAKWSKLMYLTAQFPTESLIECGSFCQTETPDKCDLYAIKSNACHIGKFDNSATTYLASQSGTNPVYVNFGNDKDFGNIHICRYIRCLFSEKLVEALKVIYTEITQINTPVKWSKYIYKSVELAETETFLDCSFQCGIVESDTGCQLFLFHVSHTVW